MRLIIGCAALLAVSFFWWNSSPHLERGFIYAPVREIRAEGAGTVLDATLREGDYFQKGSKLFALSGNAEEQLKQLDLRLARSLQVLDQTNRSAGEVKAQFACLKTALADGPSELVGQIRAEVEEWDEKVSRIEEEISSIECERESTLTQLAKQSAIAASEGLVLQRLVEPGDKVETGVPLLLVCFKDLSIEVEIPEDFFSKISLNLPAKVKLPSFPGKTWHSHVSWISPIAKDGKLKIRLAAQDLPFKPGLTAEVALLVN